MHKINIILIMWFIAVLCVSNVVEKNIVDGDLTFVGSLFWGEALTELSVVYNTSANVTLLPSTVSVPTNVYTYRMPQDSTLTTGTVVPSISYAIIATSHLHDFTLLHLYKTTFVFLGKPPREFTPHIVELGCTSAAWQSHTFDGTVNGNPVKLTFSKTNHIVTSGVCGNVDLVLGSIQIPVWIDCASSIVGNKSVLSGPLLGLGFYAGNSEICLYRGNNDEINHTMAITVVAVLFVFLVVWIDWTRNLWSRVVNGESDQVWLLIISYSIVVYQYIGLIASVNIFAWAQGTHSMYSFAALRMVSIDVVDVTAMTYSWVVTPVLAAYALICLSFARATFGKTPENKPLLLFTWGLSSLETKSLTYRSTFTLFAFASTVAIVYGVWFLAVEDEAGGYASAGTVTVALLAMSTPDVLVKKLQQVVDPTHKALKEGLLIMFAWTMKFMIITCLCNNLPFDVAGHLNNTFHSGVTFAMGCALLIITGRDVAHTLLTLAYYKYSSKKIMVVAGVFLPLILFVVWYVTLFSLGGMYSNSGALQNHGDLATLCAGSFSTFVFSLAFSISVHDGRVTKSKKQP